MSLTSRPMLSEKDVNEECAKIAEEFLSDDGIQFRYQPTGHEEVTPHASILPPIPAGDNPFWHDSMSMGTSLVRGWVLMHPGFDSKEDPRAMEWVYLVNTRTGQRIQITLHHEPTTDMVRAQRNKWDQESADDSIPGDEA